MKRGYVPWFCVAGAAALIGIALAAAPPIAPPANARNDAASAKRPTGQAEQGAAPAGAKPGAPKTAPVTVLRFYDASDLLRISADISAFTVVPPSQLISGQLSRPPIADPGYGLAIRTGPGNELIESPYDRASRNSETTVRERLLTAARSLVSLIESQVDPSSWIDSGGKIGSIFLYGDRLAVRQTPENHRLVAELLAGLRNARAAERAMTLQADWLLLEPGEVASLLAHRAAQGIGGQIDAAALATLPAADFFARGRSTCLSGQTTQLISGRARTLIDGAEAQVGTASAAYQPDVQRELSGAALQVTPRLVGDAVTIDVISFVSMWNPLGKPYRVGARTSSILVQQTPTTRSVSTLGAFASIDRLNVPAQQLAASACVAMGKYVLIGGMTAEPDVDGAPANDPLAAKGRQIYLVLRLDPQ